MTDRDAKRRKIVTTETLDEDSFAGPSPNPKTNLLVADVALRGGAALVRHAIERALLREAYDPDKARKLMKRRSVGESLASAAVARLAMRSVPGAILVGGGLLAKTLFDRRLEKKQKQREHQAVAEALDDDLTENTYTGGY